MNALQELLMLTGAVAWWALGMLGIAEVARFVRARKGGRKRPTPPTTPAPPSSLQKKQLRRWTEEQELVANGKIVYLAGAQPPTNRAA